MGRFIWANTRHMAAPYECLSTTQHAVLPRAQRNSPSAGYRDNILHCRSENFPRFRKALDAFHYQNQNEVLQLPYLTLVSKRLKHTNNGATALKVLPHLTLWKPILRDISKYSKWSLLPFFQVVTVKHLYIHYFPNLSLL